MNLLFVCKYNCFRSRVAEAIFNNFNKNKKINVKSAGYSIGSADCILDRAAEVLDEMNIPYNKKQTSVQLNSSMIKWADKIVIVADDISSQEFPENKTVRLNIPDAYHSMDKTKETINIIEKEVKQLVKNFSNAI